MGFNNYVVWLGTMVFLFQASQSAEAIEIGDRFILSGDTCPYNQLTIALPWANSADAIYLCKFSYGENLADEALVYSEETCVEGARCARAVFGYMPDGSGEYTNVDLVFTEKGDLSKVNFSTYRTSWGRPDYLVSRNACHAQKAPAITSSLPTIQKIP